MPSFAREGGRDTLEQMHQGGPPAGFGQRFGYISTVVDASSLDGRKSDADWKKIAK